MDEWVAIFRSVCHIDCFGGRHPNVYVPRERPHGPFESIEDVNNYLLRHPDVVDYIRVRADRCGSEKAAAAAAVFLMFDQRTEELCDDHDSPQAADALCPPAEQACRPLGHYRDQWWVLDPDRGVLLAAGIYGQYLYVDMSAGVVLAKLSSLPEPLDVEVSADTLTAFAAVVAALS